MPLAVIYITKLPCFYLDLPAVAQLNSLDIFGLEKPVHWEQQVVKWLGTEANWHTPQTLPLILLWFGHQPPEIPSPNLPFRLPALGICHGTDNEKYAPNHSVCGPRDTKSLKRSAAGNNRYLCSQVLEGIFVDFRDSGQGQKVICKKDAKLQEFNHFPGSV